jgi:pimeloyl-ACP methyl ester carboxylesterase
LDGYGGNATDFLTETKLYNVACANDFLTVCIPTGINLYADSSVIKTTNEILSEIIKTYKVKKDQFILGGHSSGGTIILRYAELCKEKPLDYPISPKAVFTVDSPVDILGLYRSSQRDLKKGFDGWWLGESQMIIDTYNKLLGKPELSLKKYRQASPFLREDSLPGNEKFLKDVAYRTYHDVDINWHIQNRRRSFYETNMLDASELVSRLVLAGNNSAEFIASKQPGRRSNGYRHPHSWSIVDEVDLVQWAKEKLNFYPDHIKKPYSYKAPENWSSEVILFPIDFAPALAYKGFEDLRFAPGWGDEKSNERWAYTLLWWLDDNYTFDEKILQQNLESYFTGLTRRRAVADKLNMQTFTNAKAQVKKTGTDNNDISTYTATVNIFDAQVTKKPNVLYIKIHIKNCLDKSNTILLFEVSALPSDKPVWQQLDKLNTDIRCFKK